MDHISGLLGGVVNALGNLPNSEIASAKHNLRSKATRIMQKNEQGIRKRTKTMSNQKGIPFVTEKDGELIPGLLVYVMEGVLPLLKVYMRTGDMLLVCELFLFCRFTMANISYLMMNLLVLLVIQLKGHLLRKRFKYQLPLPAH